MYSNLVIDSRLPAPANMKHASKMISAAVLAVAIVAPVAAQQTDPLKEAVASEQRHLSNKQRDEYRHPYETLSFFGIRPDMTVVELTPGAGWYTEILAPYLRDKGTYIAGVYDPQSDKAAYRRYASLFKDFLATNPVIFNKVKVSVFEPPAKLDFAPPGTVDMVLTFRNLHNWVTLGEPAMAQIFKSIYTALKRGGVLGIVEHRLPEDRQQDATASTGYMHQSYVVQMAQKAGFQLQASSEINANPRDTADHPGGVWALPPSYRNKDTDRAKYQAIGESDRMTLKFVKPR